ncbi:hypothetical protein KC734_10860 [candidate division KSB1 bacterium]|nr:hypothetical protein [candidate division KSB1 bacterium]
MRKLLLVCLAMLLSVNLFDGSLSKARAQNFDLSIYNTADLSDVVDPIMKFFGTIGGAGFVNTAKLHNFGGFDISARVVGVMIPDEYSGIAGLVPDQSGALTSPFKNENLLAFPFLTASVGLFGNLEVMARLFHYPLGDDPLRGGVTLLGGGLKYGLVQTGLIPKITIIGAYQALMVPDEFDFGTVKIASLKAFASKDFLIFTVYGGGGVDKTYLTVDFAGLPADFNGDYNATNSHGTVGFGATVFPFVKVNGEYNFGTFNSFTLGASVSIR